MPELPPVTRATSPSRDTPAQGAQFGGGFGGDDPVSLSGQRRRVAPAARPDIQHGTRPGGEQVQHLSVYLAEGHALVLLGKSLRRLAVSGGTDHGVRLGAVCLAVHGEAPYVCSGPVTTMKITDREWRAAES
ncbi:hypothetical protein V1460_32030 [Streptomyces sp. SCSIO 30461]|uniref:hypothetical protein n=1 Tax=Streptomyces sp. SCSIO 30461 TaxID=3118085 RepID=UPI0030CBC59A